MGQATGALARHDGSGADGGLAAGGDGGRARPGREILGQLGVPRSRGFGHRPLRRHPFFYRPPAIITFIRFHWSPLR